MPALAIPLDGRLTSQNILTGPLTGGEVMPIVSPGNATQGNSYQVTTLILAQFISTFIALTPTTITSGSTYNSVATDTRILVNLGVAGALGITMLPSSNYLQPILIKDIAGNVSSGSITTISFSSGQTADGLSTIQLQNAYAGIWLNPLASGGFYLTAA